MAEKNTADIGFEKQIWNGIAQESNTATSDNS